jgi:hypothetical protein
MHPGRPVQFGGLRHHLAYLHLPNPGIDEFVSFAVGPVPGEPLGL